MAGVTTLPAISEAAFMRQVTDLAELLGWSWAHFRPAQTSRGWRTPVSGPLGQGFPDLVLVHPQKSRRIFAELKRNGARTSPDQDRVLECLRAIEWVGVGHGGPPDIAVAVWRPADLELVAAVLR